MVMANESVVINSSINNVSSTEKILLEIKSKVEGLENSVQKCRKRLKNFERKNRRSLLEHDKKITTLATTVKSLKMKLKKGRKAFQRLENTFTDKNYDVDQAPLDEDMQENHSPDEALQLEKKEKTEEQNKKQKKKRRCPTVVENGVTTEEIETLHDPINAEDRGSSTENYTVEGVINSDFICSTCQKSCDNFLHLRYHSLICQLSAESHGCPICPEYFQDIQELYRHLEDHENRDKNSGEDCEENAERSSEIEQCHGIPGNELDNIENTDYLSAHPSTEIVQENEREQDEISDSRLIDQTLILTLPPSRRKSERICKLTRASGATEIDNLAPESVDQGNSPESEETSNSLEESQQNVRDLRKSSDTEAASVLSDSQTSNETSNSLGDTSASHSKYQCKTCSTIFSDSRSLHYHLNKIHPDAAPYKCERCDIVFVNQNGYDKHVENPAHKTHIAGMYQCWYCDYVADRRVRLRHHLTSFGENGPKDGDFRRCSQCKSKFCTNESLAFHVKKKHVKLMPYSCIICAVMFSREKYLNDHSKLHKYATDFKCFQCKNYFRTANQLLQHAEFCKASSFSEEKTLSDTTSFEKPNETSKLMVPPSAKRLSLGNTSSRPTVSVVVESLDIENSLHRCQTCSQIFTTIESLSTHMMAKHSEGAPYKCKTCDKDFTHFERLLKHNCEKSKKDVEHCPYCDYTPSEKFKLRQHLKSRREPSKLLRCLYCRSQFCTPFSLLSHTKRIHRTSIYIKRGCPTCNKEFPNRVALSKHKQRCKLETNDSELEEAHTKKSNNSDTVARNPVPTAELISTKLATKIKKRVLKRRLPTNIIPAPTKVPQPENNCEEKLKKSRGKYSCQICEKTFWKKIKLLRHNRTHKILKLVPSIKYSCKFCHDSFSKWTEFQAHVKVHQESRGISKTLPPSSRGMFPKRKIKCSQCVKEFSNQDSMYSHFLVAHAWVKPFKCRQCPLSFCTRDGLRRHGKSHPDSD